MNQSPWNAIIPFACISRNHFQIVSNSTPFRAGKPLHFLEIRSKTSAPQKKWFVFHFRFPLTQSFPFHSPDQEKPKLTDRTECDDTRMTPPERVPGSGQVSWKHSHIIAKLGGFECKSVWRKSHCLSGILAVFMVYATPRHGRCPAWLVNVCDRRKEAGLSLWLWLVEWIASRLGTWTWTIGMGLISHPGFQNCFAERRILAQAIPHACTDTPGPNRLACI